MWELHLSLKDGLVGDEKEYLIDTVSSMLDKISKQDFIQALNMLYKDFSAQNKNPIQIIIMFISGLKKNDFFEFHAFVKGLTNGRSARG